MKDYIYRLQILDPLLPPFFSLKIPVACAESMCMRVISV